ncbi:MAG: hypothetical protein DRO08_02660 [Thermoprotei archaeon]|nr:MAG: hypothetical protein DRO08_02660 [Thermoprotei archaeon]
MNNISLLLLFAICLSLYAFLNMLYIKYRERFKSLGIEVAGITLIWRVIRKELYPTVKVLKRLKKHGLLLDLLVVLIVLSFLLALKIYVENLVGMLKSVMVAESPEKGIVTPIVPIIPGITVSLSMLPMLILVIAVAVLVHEGMHAIVGLIEGTKIKSFGVALVFIILAPFVEIDENDFAKLKLRSKLRILSAGVAGNVILALLSLLLFLYLIPVLFNVHWGLYVSHVVEDMPAYEANLPNGTVIVAINGTKLGGNLSMFDYLFNSRVLLRELSGFKKKGRVLVLTLMNPKPPYDVHNYTIIRENITQPIGVVLYPYAVLEPRNFIAKLLGTSLQTFLIWSFALNLGLAAINATPLFITDGGKALDEFSKSKLGKLGYRVSRSVQFLFVSIVLINIIASFILYMR